MIAKTTSGCREMKRIIIGVCLFLVILTIIVLMLSGQSGNKKTTQYRSTSLKEMVSQSGDVERIDYVDVKGTITVAAEKYYATRIKTTSGLSVLEEFFDADGKPAEQPSGYYAILREFNEKGQNYRVTYLGSNQECGEHGGHGNEDGIRRVIGNEAKRRGDWVILCRRARAYREREKVESVEPANRDLRCNARRECRNDGAEEKPKGNSHLSS